MAKNLKLNLKNSQLAKALGKKGLTVKGKEKPEEEKKPPETGPATKPAAKGKPAAKAKSSPKGKEEAASAEEVPKRRVRARKRSAFAAPDESVPEESTPDESSPEPEVVADTGTETPPEDAPPETPEVAEAAPVEQPPPPPPKKESGPPRPRPRQIEKPSFGVSRPRIAPAKGVAPSPKKDVPPSAPKAKGPVHMREDRKPAPGRKKDLTRPKPVAPMRSFDSRDRYGLRQSDDQAWRRRRRKGRGGGPKIEREVIRPKELTIRLPITIKDLAAAMKLKASQLITKLFMQGVTLTLNDHLDDETTVQLLGAEFECEITIDTSEEERIRITDQSVKEEIAGAEPDQLRPRAPVVAFMGHVDHGKTSLIDRIRKSNIASGEAGAITQHIGAFRCVTEQGPITILDTPGHEAFTAMRARGADITDVVVLVVAGDEGVMPQTEEAIQHAKEAGVTILIALNKSDKPGFNAENVYRQLSELELLPEAWGGSTVTVNCSAATGDGIDTLLEMVALQADVLELHANPNARARGSVVESEMHKGLGIVATVLVQNGTLRKGDPLVFDDLWGRVKTMKDEHGKDLTEAPPSTPVAITGLSDLPSAGSEFIAVQTEKEAQEIADVRRMGQRESRLASKRRATAEGLLQQAAEAEKKLLKLIIRADVQGSLEALKTSLGKIESDKAEVDIIFSGVGAISESDVELAAASGAVIFGFHTQVESHAEQLVKQHGVQVRLHDIIYHAIDEAKALLTGTLEKLAEEHDRGVAEVRAVFKASQLGKIAGCIIQEGTINRNHRIRQIRDGEVIWKGSISSIRRDKEDVREVKGGFECGIVLDGQNDINEGDLLQAYEVVYVEQEL